MKNFSFIKIVFVVVCLIYGANAQSTKIDFPTPVTRDELNGKIPARDVGDSRLTTHYYIFEGKQGDIFINIEANNLDGDIDIFLAENLKPLTKINLYADSGVTQTGRELYLRKAEKLILRVEGRTPNDDAATYSIKFSGSFQAVAAKSVPEEPKLPEIKVETNGEVKVNSVGTIVEIPKPKATPKPKETVAKAAKEGNNKANPVPVAVSTVKPKAAKPKAKIEEPKEPEKKVEVVVTDNLPKPVETENKEEKGTETTTGEKIAATPKPKATKPKTTAKKTTPTKAKKTPPAKPTNTENEELTKVLESIRLVVEFKDGGKIERPMNEVLRFGVDKGVLTIVNKDGKIGKYSILEITKISVE
jgi:hypothetical protein